MKTIIKLTTLILTVFLAFGCDYSQLENKLNDLEGRITALEESVSAVNANAIALRAIMKEGILIVDYKTEDNGYKISLSDGTVVDVIFGKTAPGIIPTIGINAEGKWVMSLDGENFTLISGAQLVDAEDGQLRGDGSGGGSGGRGRSGGRAVGAAGGQGQHQGQGQGGGDHILEQLFHDKISFTDVVCLGWRDGRGFSAAIGAIVR